MAEATLDAKLVPQWRDRISSRARPRPRISWRSYPSNESFGTDHDGFICRDGTPASALAAGRQLMIMRLAALAFFESRFAKDTAARTAYDAFLRETLAHDFPEATSSVRRGVLFLPPQLELLVRTVTPFGS